MKSDILFFNPPQTKNGSNLQNRALLWIASYLQQSGFSVRVFYLDSAFEKTIKKALDYYRPKNVAVSCKWYTNLYGAILVAKEIRKFNRDIKIITGGHTATYFDKELLQTGYFDLVVRGDAEIPLLNILKSKTPISCTLKDNNRIKRYALEYTQENKDLENYTLSEPSEILENAAQILSAGNFIWTGKGCSWNCFYCGGSLKAQRKFFGRKKAIYRPIPDVLTDISILSRYSYDLMFDFACPPDADNYYLQLFKEIPRQKFRVNFFHWGIPSIKFINKMSTTFSRTLIHLDTSTLCEQLRGSLSRKKLLKPFFTNKNIEEVIKYCDKKKNIRICLENIAGLPGENKNHVEEHISFSQYLSQKYTALADISYIPLSVEPGAILQELHKKLGMHLCRNTFADFLCLTQCAFQANIAYPFSEFFKKQHWKDFFPFPYGIYQRGLNRKSSYARAKAFLQVVGRELRANTIAYRYRVSKEP